jgi:hypothetical protein
MDKILNQTSTCQTPKEHENVKQQANNEIPMGKNDLSPQVNLRKQAHS